MQYFLLTTKTLAVHSCCLFTNNRFGQTAWNIIYTVYIYRYIYIYTQNKKSGHEKQKQHIGLRYLQCTNKYTGYIGNRQWAPTVAYEASDLRSWAKRGNTVDAGKEGTHKTSAIMSKTSMLNLKNLYTSCFCTTCATLFSTCNKKDFLRHGVEKSWTLESKSNCQCGSERVRFYFQGM